MPCWVLPAAAACGLFLAIAARPAAAAGWDRYEIILWHNHGPAALAAARRLGVTAGLAFGVRDDLPEAALGLELDRRAAPLRAAGLGLYVENIATDFYAAYHRWQPDRSLTWRFDEAHARHAADPGDASAFVREPSLSDPAALARVAARLQAHVRALGTAPLYYDLGDETGIADLTAAWDFDLSDASLAAMRVWLRGQYGTLDALNTEWGTGFATWDAVRPLLTDAALLVRDGNFAAWADFKAWMDTAFARAVRAGAEAVHAGDPAARAGLEGAQAPGWGGYDYTQLAPAVDVMEVTAAELAQPLALAMHPGLVTLTTLTGGPDAPADLWRAALAGYRGAVLWDPDARIARPDGSPGPDGAALAGTFAELGGPLGARLLAAAPHTDPVAILYSPPSFRTRWILDRQIEADAGQDWSRRVSETELGDNALRAAMRQAADGLAHLALQPRYLSPAMLAGGALQQNGLRVLILPHVLALSDAELAAIGAFIANGGAVLADVPPGGYDAHSRRRPAPLLTAGVTLLPGLPRAALAAHLAVAGVTPAFTLTRLDGAPATDATLRVFDEPSGGMLLGVQREPGGDPGVAADNAPLLLILAQPRWLHDLRHGGPARRTRRLLLDSALPALLSAAARP